MSVLIRGIEKPDHCLRCPMKGFDDECVLQGVEVCAEYEKWEQQMANCPLVPVPPHGRLIDADALEKEHMKRAYENFRSYQFHVSATAWINEAPTIIPAEEAPAKDINVPRTTYDLLYEEGGAGTT